MIAALLLACVAQDAASTARTTLRFERFEVDAKASKIGFEGSSTLHDFSGSAKKLGGELRVDPRAPATTGGGTLWVEAESLDTGNGSRDKDMREDLKSSEFRRIGFVLESLSGSLDGWSGRLDARGRFIIAGVERARSFPALLEPAGAGFRAKGELRFKMSEHGIEPPSVLFVDVDDEVKVVFDVVMQPLAAPRIPARVRTAIVHDASSAANGEGIDAHDRIWWTERGFLWERAGAPTWIVADRERATEVDMRAAIDRGPPAPIEPRFEELRRKLAQLDSGNAKAASSERTTLETALRSAPAAGDAEVVREEGALAIRLGGVEWIRFEGLAGEDDFAPLCAGLEGVPASVIASLREIHGVPTRAVVRCATPTRVLSLEIRIDPAREGELPDWALDPASWTHAPPRKP